MAKREIHVDTLRGLACVLLVTYHVIGSDSTSGLRVQEGDPMRLFNDSLVYVRMPLFAFLSGFVYAWRPFQGDAGQFVAGKVRRLLIPMLLAGTFFALLQAHTPGANHTEYDWSMLHIVPVAHFWFLESLFLIFLVVAAIEQLGWLRIETSFVAIWLGAVALHLANPLPVYFGLLGAVYLLPYFLLGIWCNRFGARYADSRALTVSTCILISTIAIVVWQHAGFPSRNAWSSLALGVSACVLLQRIQVKSTWLAWIGVHSFTIYLFHPIFSAASRIFLDRVADLPDGILLAAGLSAGLFGPIAAEAVLRRLPAIGSWVLGETPSRMTASRAGGAKAS